MNEFGLINVIGKPLFQHDVFMSFDVIMRTQNGCYEEDLLSLRLKNVDMCLKVEGFFYASDYSSDLLLHQ